MTVRPGCTYSLSTTSISFDAAGGARTINVQAPSGCAWQVSGEYSWITITGGSGSGSGTVRLAIAPNTASSSRNASIQIATQTLTVTQSGVVTAPISETFAFDLAPLDKTTLIYDDAWFFEVPAGATRLTVRLATSTGGVDLDLFVRFGSKPSLTNGQVVADYRSESLTGSETISVSGNALRTGRYYFAVGQFTLSRATSASVTGTIQF